MIIRHGKTILCRGLAFREPAQELAVSGQSQVQEVNTVRATVATRYNRGNLSTTISFSVSREYPTMEDASRAALEIVGEQQGIKDTLTIVTETPSATTRRYLPDALIAEVAPTQIGVTLRIRYTIRGSKLTHIKPEA